MKLTESDNETASTPCARLAVLDSATLGHFTPERRKCIRSPNFTNLSDCARTVYTGAA